MTRPNPFSHDDLFKAIWDGLASSAWPSNSFLGSAIKKTAKQEVDKIVADKKLESDIDKAVKIIWKYGDIL